MVNNLYIGFDCAIKSLAVLFFLHNTQSNDNQILYIGLYKMINYKMPKMNNNFIVKISSILKSILFLLDNILNNIIIQKNIENIYILIEHQFKSSSSSRIIENMILYHYSTNQPIDNISIDNFYCNEINYKKKILNKKKSFPNIYTKIIGPSLKNKYEFYIKLRYSEFVEKYSTLKAANKNHTKENFKYYLKNKNKIKCLLKFKKNNIDDIADSFMMIIGYICNNKNLNPEIFLK